MKSLYKSAALGLTFVLVALAMTVLAPASASAQSATSTGSITVCKMILNADGSVATSSANLPAGTFSIEVGYKASTTAATTSVATVSFDASNFAPNTKVLSSTENDADCETPAALSSLAFTDPSNPASYVYGPEAVVGGGWMTPLYHDQNSASTTATTTFYIYGTNTDSDGFVEVSALRSSRTLIVLNSVASTSTATSTATSTNSGNGGSNGGNGGGGGGGSSSNLRISDEEVKEVLPGVAFVNWETNRNATGQVVYGTRSVDDEDIDKDDDDDNFGYEFSSVELTDLIDEHGMAVGGLQDGVTYYFRPVSRRGGRTAIGDEVTLVPGGGSGTSCVYLNDYLKRGWSNDPTEVRKLQTFLRDVEGHSGLQLTGTFDDATFAAVSVFQEKYKADILTPWGHDRATGFVYILTKKKINEIYCNDIFPLTLAQQQEIVEFRTLMESLKGQGITVPTNGGQTGGGSVGPAVPGETPDVIPGETEVGVGGATSTATGTDELDRGVFGNLAAAVFSLPENGTEATRCVFNLIIILAIIYIITSILVSNDETPEMTKRKIRTRKLTFFLAGVIIATAFALFFDMFCLVLPLLVALIGLIAALIVNKMRGGSTGAGTGTGVGAPPMSPLIVEQPKTPTAASTAVTPPAAPTAAPAGTVTK